MTTISEVENGKQSVKCPQERTEINFGSLSKNLYCYYDTKPNCMILTSKKGLEIFL